MGTIQVSEHLYCEPSLYVCTPTELTLLQFGLRDPSLIHHQGYIDGKWVDAEDGKKFSVTSTLSSLLVCGLHYLRCALDPATAEELGQVADLGLDQTKQAIEAASKAFKTWGKTTAKVCICWCLKSSLSSS